MKTETLEALLIDRALGHLTPEMDELLAEHLAANPATARLAAELQETVTLAVAALKRPLPVLKLPPPAVAALPPRRVFRPLALAASFLAGIGLTLVATRIAAPPREHAVASTPIVVSVQPAAGLAIDPSVRALPFWSKERALALAAAKQSTR
jgi:hypothetical protein